MGVFSEKLNRIHETISLVEATDIRPIANAINEGRHRVAIAVGSGGSAVAAEYLARCRSTLSCAPTIVKTPMDLVVDDSDLRGCDVWLFSAGADNPDVAAAFDTALASDASSIRLVTVRADGATTARARASGRCAVDLLPVADPKDGFLATHSMIATVAALLAACEDQAARHIQTTVLGEFAKDAEAALGAEARLAIEQTLEGFERTDTLLVLHDPQLRAVGVLIETSMWETAICPVQRSDFRNFAHGRHVWLAQRPEHTRLLALTGLDGIPIWTAIDRLLPEEVPRTSFDFGGAGRFRVAMGIVSGLAVVEALGIATGIDPGKPGAGPFAKPIYEDRSLEELARRLVPRTRQKRLSLGVADASSHRDRNVEREGQSRLDALLSACFSGIVLDYDGTIVATEDRLAPPSAAIVEELVRLADAGIDIAIATGRGGSSGEMLRQVLPERLHANIVVGYYNGAYIRTLDVDIAKEPATSNADLADVFEWLNTRKVVAAGRIPKAGPLQITVNNADLLDAAAFPSVVARCPAVIEGRIKVVRSQHSFDIVPSTTSKTEVVKHLLASHSDAGAEILAIGDSGQASGNDYELLTLQHGISVGAICGDPDGSWSLFGQQFTGPQALLRILLASKIDGTGRMRLDGAALFDDLR